MLSLRDCGLHFPAGKLACTTNGTVKCVYSRDRFDCSVSCPSPPGATRLRRPSAVRSKRAERKLRVWAPRTLEIGPASFPRRRSYDMPPNLALGFLWPPCIADADVMFLLCFFLLFSSPNLSGCIEWMSTILPHMVWPQCEFRMQVGNVLHAACWKWDAKMTSRHHRTTLSSQLGLRHVSTIGKKLVKQLYLLHMSS